MTDAIAHKFNSHAEFDAHLRDCLGRARMRLDMFDPDFAVFALGSSETDALLRRFLGSGGSMRLAMHRSAHIERHYPRFVRLLREFNHKIEVRATQRALHHLTDSFCIADGMHIVRRFHSDHMRGEAVFDSPPATELSQERFEGIWIDAVSTLHPTTTGL